MFWGYGSALFFTLIPNPTSKPAQTILKTRFYQKSHFYGTSTLNSPYGIGATDGSLGSNQDKRATLGSAEAAALEKKEGVKTDEALREACFSLCFC